MASEIMVRDGKWSFDVAHSRCSSCVSHMSNVYILAINLRISYQYQLKQKQRQYNIWTRYVFVCDVPFSVTTQVFIK